MTKSLRRSAINSCWVPVYRLPRVDSFLIYGLDEYPAGQRGIKRKKKKHLVAVVVQIEARPQ